MSSVRDAGKKPGLGKGTLGAFVGTAIEWYDFFIFGTAAALVFSRVFYPDIAPGAGLLASFATFWVGFLARPLGGIVFGHFGDKFGRKNVLVVTLLLMGIATTLIGALPSYAQIGIAAPILLVLLRALQGFAVGGEWGGAVLLATEGADAQKKGLAGTWVQQGSPAGAILAAVIFLIVGNLPDAQFFSWGWRIPFLLSAVLVIVALLIRMRVQESEEFVATKATRQVVKVPLIRVFATAPRALVFGILASILGISVAYFTNTFLLAWTTGTLEMDRQTIQLILLVGSIFQFIWQPIAALIAERVGAPAVMIASLALTLLLVVPFFLAIMSQNYVFLAVMAVLNTCAGAGYYGLLANALAEAFDVNVRYTGVSAAYQICATIIGGSTPLIAQSLLTGVGPWAVAIYYAALVLLTVLGVLGLRRVSLRRSATTTAAPLPTTAD
ncbi:MHS family MFS transporter [Leucobacter allii]|uniref:MHS family MFS transporter n=1 Tax=Leucobacter allii TaxID=2932247 RepID=A0ABY4FJF2_9MICO|nr:MFS transporter [Leucobacter allii]UOQ56815.1 MHS family MFS transporter [Leucobacter allii]